MTSSALERKVLGGLGLASMIIAGVTLVYYVRTTRLIESAEHVSNAQEFITALSEFGRGMQGVRMATRGYILTGDPHLRDLRRQADAKVRQSMATLRHTSLGEPHRMDHFREVKRLAQRRLEESAKLIELRDRAGALVAGVAAAGQIQHEVNDPIRDGIDHLMAETRSQLDGYARRAQAGRTAMLVMMIVGCAVELLFAAGAAVVIRRELRARKHAAEAVQERELTLRSFYESGVTMMGIVELLDGDTQFVSGNSATARMLGVTSSDELSGRRASELGTPPDLLDLFVSKYEESFRLGGPVEFEYERVMGDGTMRWFSMVVCPIRRWAPNGRPRFSYILLDVTARKAAEGALEQARREADAASAAKSNFLANMSHEIRTPMTAVLGFSDLLAEPGRSDAERIEWVSVIRRNSRHLLALINDILDLSKIEAGRMTLEAVGCDVAQIVGEVVTLMRPRATEKGILLNVDLRPPLPACVRGDPFRLRQVLVNLVGNAIKFTEAGEVSVAVCCEAAAVGHELRIEVRDTGVGMTSHQLSRLFRPFTQADETTTRRFGGTGLGLSISSLAALMGGSISVESEPGQGSSFQVRLPVVENAALSAAPALGAPERTTATPPSAVTGDARPAVSPGARVLLVEDSPDMQRLLSMLLRRATLDVTLAANGRVAIERATAEAFDLILMDMQMPEVDGYCAAAELRRRGMTVPIIALTAHAMSGDREKCLAAGCTDYLTKPVDPVHLIGVLARHLPRGSAAAA